MPKKIIFESAVHQFAMAAKDLLGEMRARGDSLYEVYRRSAETWDFKYAGPKQMVVKWSTPSPGETTVLFPDAQFYLRGDEEKFVQRQRERNLIGGQGDPVSDGNRTYFIQLAKEVLSLANPRA